MKYFLLINKDEAKYRALSAEERAGWNARYAAYGKKMIASGIVQSGAMLQPTDTATTVRVRAGRRLYTDGPFAETAEHIAGVCIIDVKNLDEALEWAANHPDAEWGSVEVRPIVEWDEKTA